MTEGEGRGAESGVDVPPTDLVDLVRYLDAIVWEYDLAADRFTFVSDRAVAILGHPVEAWTGFDFWVGLMHPDERDERAAFCQAETRAGRDHDFEYRAVAADGHIVWIRDIVRLVRDAAGAVTRLRGVMVDVTAQRRRERAHEALRNVATAVAQGSLAAVFAPAVEEAARVVDADFGALVTIDETGGLVTVAGHPACADGPPVDAEGVLAVACHTGAPARRAGAPGEAHWEIAVPVVSGGRVRGALGVCVDRPLPDDAETYLAGVADLVALAVGEADERGRREASDAAQRRLATEQRAVSRIVTAVAEDRPADEVFAMVAEATAAAIGAEVGAVLEFAGEDIILRGLSRVEEHAVGDQLPMHVVGALQEVRRTGRATRLSAAEMAAEDAIGEAVRREGVTSVVMVPVPVGGETWGCLAVASREDALPGDTEARMEAFARTAATAVSHGAARARLVQLATTDALTGLANHRYFQERLRDEVARAKRHGRPLTLVLIDLDGFKLVNDTYGHAVGDQALVEVARRLRELAGPGDVLARTGGDEFAWILAEADSLAGYAAAERARAAIALTPLLTGVRADTSAGVCGLEEAVGPDELLRLADGALYWAKAHGRGVTYRYTPDVVRELSASERADRLARQRTLAGLRALARAVDAKDPSTREHSERVAELAAQLAGDLGWSESEIDALREAALLHDVGKIGVPDAILFKPASLTLEEFEQVKPHAALGATIASEVLGGHQIAWIRGHHERWDGRGYPDGLTEETIPEGARLLALADSWDVMTHVRSYKSALTPADALDECRRSAGLQFWPDAVAALERLWGAGRVVVAVEAPAA